MKLYELLINISKKERNQIKCFEEEIIVDKNNFLSEWFTGFNLYEKFEDNAIENIISPYKIYDKNKKYMCFLHFIITSNSPTLSLEAPKNPKEFNVKEGSHYATLYFNNKKEIDNLILQIKLRLSNNYKININFDISQIAENIIYENNELLYVDNPGGEWLKNQRDRASKSRFGSGALTANIGISKPVDLKVSYIANLDGVNGEEEFRSGGIKYRDLKKSIEKQGWKPDPVMIWVDYLGIAKIAEGNHRIFIANQMGIEWIPGDIRYFAGGEEMPGKFNPATLQKLRVIRKRQPEQ